MMILPHKYRTVFAGLTSIIVKKTPTNMQKAICPDLSLLRLIIMKLNMRRMLLPNHVAFATELESLFSKVPFLHFFRQVHES